MTTQDLILLQAALEQHSSALEVGHIISVMVGNGADACEALDEMRAIGGRLSAISEALKMSIALDDAEALRLLDSTTLAEQRAICAAMINH